MHKCWEWFQRRHITTHETQQCKKRPYSCDYCRDYHSTFEDVTEVHYPQCGKYPVACPNDCDVYKFERQRLMKENQELRHEVGALKLEMLQLVSQSGFPVDYQVKQTDEEVHLPDFYTHPHGYQMCVCVYPNGNGDGKGTHVPVFTYMMQGPFDDYLKWPF